MPKRKQNNPKKQLTDLRGTVRVSIFPVTAQGKRIKGKDRALIFIENAKVSEVAARIDTLLARRFVLEK